MPRPSARAAADDLRDKVMRALEARDLLPAPRVYERTLRRVLDRGETCRREFLLPVIGRRAWRDVGRRLKSNDSTLAGVLGFGEAMTEFFVAGVPMPPRARSLVIRIGALSKFILSTYDKLVDNLGEKDLIPRSMLLRAMSDGPHSGRQALPTDSSRRVITRAVNTYFELLHRLPFAHERVHVRQLLGSAIVGLFDVEARLRLESQAATSFREETVRSKATLSFVSMGLPAWLASPRADRERVLSHRQWLCQLGEFLGWIDDLMDIEEDVAMGFANRVVMRLQRPHAHRPKALTALGDEIAALGSDIANEWTRRLPAGSRHRHALACFKTNVFSWLGGPRHLWI